MEIQIDNYIVKIQLLNNFTKREITKSRIKLLSGWIEKGEYSGTFDIWTDDDFPENIEDSIKWKPDEYGLVFNWNVIDYVSQPDTMDNTDMVKCYQYQYKKTDYDYSIEKIILLDKPMFSSKYKLLEIGYCSKNLITKID